METRTSANTSGAERRCIGSRNPQSAIRNPQLCLEEIDYDELLEPIRFSFAIDRRSFVQMLGAGVLITAIGAPVFGQRRGRTWAAAAVFAVGRRRRCRRGFISATTARSPCFPARWMAARVRGASWRRRRRKSCACR